MIGALAARNNLRVKNARQPVNLLLISFFLLHLTILGIPCIYMAVKLWQELPIDLKHVKHFNFRKKVKQYLL